MKHSKHFLNTLGVAVYYSAIYFTHNCDAHRGLRAVDLITREPKHAIYYMNALLIAGPQHSAE